MFSSQNSQVSSAANYIEDCFSTYLYTGNGSTQTITNGIDLSTKGGLTWIKRRDAAADHYLFDTVRGVDLALQSDTAAAQLNVAGNGINPFNTNGFTVNGSLNRINQSASTYASWTFREQPKFFDVVTFTTDSGGNATVNHSLGTTPGFVIVKCTGATSDWYCWHRSLPSTNYVLRLQNTDAQFDCGVSVITPGSSTVQFTNGLLAPSQTQVMYIFAHNAGGFGLTGTDNVISCGSFTTDGSGNATVNLGYEPQWLLTKNISGAEAWVAEDNMRGFSMTGDAWLLPNSSGAEFAVTADNPTATGFSVSGRTSNATFIYIAIRRGPMKVPTSGTSVFDVQFEGNVPDGNAPFTRSSTGVVDLAFRSYRPGGVWNGSQVWSRLQDSNYFNGTASTGAEVAGTTGCFAYNNGWYNSAATSTLTSQIDWMFRRAPSFFDEVCYTGTGSATTFSHNLGVVPELMIVKGRTGGFTSWHVYNAASASANDFLRLQTTGAYATDANIFGTRPTSTVFSVGASTGVNGSGTTYVAYLFATCAGVSKVGSYTGNGSSQTINCGFTGGARFVLIKRTDSTGDWYVWDTARGIVTANDPHLSLNTTAAEVTTDDTIDTDSTGFIVNQVTATNVNVSSATYIYLAIA